MENRILLIVDPQIDFISGSLSTKNGAAAMDRLVDYLEKNWRDYSEVILTSDSHPANHCSFQENGGPFPKHCVIGTDGEKVYPPLHGLLERLHSEGLACRRLVKGNNYMREEFSVFQNRWNGEILVEYLERERPEVDVCGIATDYCVYETVKDLHEAFPTTQIRVLRDYCAAVDELDDKLENYVLVSNNVHMVPERV